MRTAEGDVKVKFGELPAEMRRASPRASRKEAFRWATWSTSRRARRSKRRSWACRS
ncbi:hypothetical protein ACFQX6_15790 [Streptosporangium lutulentum]